MLVIGTLSNKFGVRFGARFISVLVITETERKGAPIIGHNSRHLTSALHPQNFSKSTTLLNM